MSVQFYECTKAPDVLHSYCKLGKNLSDYSTSVQDSPYSPFPVFSFHSSCLAWLPSLRPKFENEQ